MAACSRWRRGQYVGPLWRGTRGDQELAAALRDRDRLVVVYEISWKVNLQRVSETDSIQSFWLDELSDFQIASIIH